VQELDNKKWHASPQPPSWAVVAHAFKKKKKKKRVFVVILKSNPVDGRSRSNITTYQLDPRIHHFKSQHPIPNP
jgi:hypothetical protein